MKKQILFICNGNIERSVVAAQSLRNILKEKRIGSNFLVDSFGLQGTKGTALPKHKHLSEYRKEWTAAQPILKKLKIDIHEHSFQKITPEIAKKVSVIIAMDEKVYTKNKNALLKQFPKQKNKIHLFSELTLDHKGIQDPAGNGSKEIHGNVLEKIHSTLVDHYKTILRWTN